MVQDKQTFSTAKQWRLWFLWKVRKGLTCHSMLQLPKLGCGTGTASSWGLLCCRQGLSLLQGLLLALQSATEQYKMLQDVARKPQLFCTEEKSNLLWVAVPGLPLRRCWVAHEAKQRVELRGLKTHVLGSLSTCPLPQKPEQQTHSANKRRKSRICLAALQKVLDLHSGPPLVVFLFAPFLVVLRRISILSRNL